MKKLILLIIFLSFFEKSIAQIGINTTNTAPDTKAMLDISSTTKGLLIPRMTSSQRTTLLTIEALTVYDTDTHSYWFFKTPGGWTELASGGASPWTIAGTDIVNSNTGNVGIGTIAPIMAGLIVNKKIGNSNAIFGDNTSGVSIESGWPGIHFNSYYNGSRKMISNGYTSGSEMDPATGTFSIYTSPLNTLIGNTVGVFYRLNIDKNGNVGIGLSNPSSLLHLNGNMKINNNNSIELGAGIGGKEVNAGKIGYGVFTPNTIDIVGAGTNTSNRKIRFWAEGGSTFEGPIEIYAPLKAGGNAGTSGQVLTSNGNLAPNWTNTALSNNTRFLVTFFENDASIQVGKVASLTKTIVEINSTVYNLNTTNISISGNTITVNKTGLYHLNILLGFNLITAESYYNAAQVYLDLNAGYASPLTLEPDAGPFNKGRTACCPNHAWSCGFNKSMDLYITAGSVLTLRKSFGLYTTNFRLEGNLSGHLISE
jgi:hypothetical protein